MITEKQVSDKLEKIENGKIFIDDIVKNYSMDKLSDAIILFPHDDEDINKAAFKYMPAFKAHYNIDRIFVLAKDEIKNMPYYNDNVTFISVNDSDIDNILNYFSLIYFGFNFSVISFTRPDIREDKNTEYIKNLSTEQKVFYGIYYLIKYNIDDYK